MLGYIPGAAFQFDAVHIHLDQVPSEVRLKLLNSTLFSPCVVATRSKVSTKYDRSFPFELRFSRPSSASLERLPELLENVRARPVYAEIALDLSAPSAMVARTYEKRFWSAAVFADQRAGTAVHNDSRDKVTYLHLSKKPFNVATYSDLPGKGGSRYWGNHVCHLEIRLTGSPKLSSAGIASVGDLAAFDLQDYWAQSLLLYRPPTTKESFGATFRPSSVSGTARRNRASRVLSMLKRYELNGKVSLHQLVRIARLDSKLLVPMPFGDWISAVRAGQLDLPIWDAS